MKGMTVTEHRASRFAMLALLAAVLAAACGSPRTSLSPSTIGPLSTETAAPSVMVAPTGTPTIEPVTQEPGTPDPATAEPQIPEPPAASIAVDGGDPVIGELGTFTWQNGGSDAPWLNGYPIQVGSGELLTLTMAEPVPVASWSVSRQPPGSRDDFGAMGMAQGSGMPVAFPAPPPGSWSVGASIRFTGTLGSASYYWLIEVD
jgi:hypothetical protein